MHRYEDYVKEGVMFASFDSVSFEEEREEFEKEMNSPLFLTPPDVGDPGQNESPYPEDALGDSGDDACAAKDGFVPPSAVRKAAALGLELRKKFGRGGTEVGVARARDLKNGKSISRETIGRMVSYFSRHTVDKKHKDWANRSNPSPGWIAWLLWGGDPGERWCNSIWKKVNQKAGLDTQGEEEHNVPREHTLNKGMPEGGDGSRRVYNPSPDPHFTRQSSEEGCGCCDECPGCDCETCTCCNSEKDFSNYPENISETMSDDEQTAAFSITYGVICHLYGSPILAYYDLHDVESGAWADNSRFRMEAAKWTREYINKLPDSSFAFIEPAYLRGETTNKSARHLPHHDASVSSYERPTPEGAKDSESIDMAHLRNALARVNQIKPVTESVSLKEMESKARAHLAAHASKLGVGDHDKEKAMASTTPPKGKPVPKSEGPLDPYTFPRTAPSSEGDRYSLPNEVKVPGGAGNDTYKEQDETVLTKEHNHHDFAPEPGLKGIKPETSPTYKEIDDHTFPGRGGPGSGQKFVPQKSSEDAKDMNLCVEPAQQPPSVERHQPDMHKEQEGVVSGRGADMKKPGDKKATKKFPVSKKKPAPKAPWDKKSAKKMKASQDTTPGMEYMKSASLDAQDKDVDEHVESIEKCALEADLYARRFAKNANVKDLHAQADRFRACRAGMEAMETCEDHEEEEKAYVKDVFAFSFGQMNRSIKRAMRNFAEESEEPNMEAYHALLSMRADLLGEESSRHFANVAFSYQMATWMAADDSMADSAEEVPAEDAESGFDEMAAPPSQDEEECAEEMAEEMSSPEDTEGEEDMKEADVAEAINIASHLQESGLVSGLESFRSTVLTLAKMSKSDRQNWVAMASNLGGQPVINSQSKAKSPTGVTYNRASADVAEKNHIAVGSKQNAGGSAPPQQANRMLGLFMGGTKAPLFNSMKSE